MIVQNIYVDDDDMGQKQWFIMVYRLSINIKLLSMLFFFSIHSGHFWICHDIPHIRTQPYYQTMPKLAGCFFIGERVKTHQTTCENDWTYLQNRKISWVINRLTIHTATPASLSGTKAIAKTANRRDQSSSLCLVDCWKKLFSVFWKDTWWTTLRIRVTPYFVWLLHIEEPQHKC